MLGVLWAQVREARGQSNTPDTAPNTTPDTTSKTTLRGVALVIGQSKYKHLTPLPNPAHDADQLEALLNQLGFETNTVTNRKVRRLRRDIDYLSEDAEEADVVLLYYSGHGVEVDGVNYLVPVDVNINETLVDARDLININETLERLSKRAEIVIILLDACRDNPFPDGARVQITRLKAGSSILAAGSVGERGRSILR